MYIPQHNNIAVYIYPEENKDDAGYVSHLALYTNLSFIIGADLQLGHGRVNVVVDI